MTKKKMGTGFLGKAAGEGKLRRRRSVTTGAGKG